MITIKQALKISAIIDKLDLKINNPQASQAEVGSDLMMQVVSKVHKAEKEIISFVTDIKKCTPEEAGEFDIFEVIKELAGNDLKVFFQSAVKSKLQG